MEETDIGVLEGIADYVFTSKYAKYIDKLKRRETWEETVDRVEEMHLKKYDSKGEFVKLQIQEAFSLVKEKKVVPSMRSMQFGGIAIEAKNERMFNCAVRHIDSIRSFSEIFFSLLNGNGVGLGINKHFLGRLPDLVKAEDKTGTVLTYVIEDTIEGWADSLEALLNCYFRNTAYTGRRIVFDYSKIRRKGTKLKTGGGKAPGYKGLKNAHTKIKNLLDHIIEEGKHSRLRSIDAYDIVMHTADAVLSGGIRRSATSVVFDKDDTEMLNAKIGDWFKENPQRGRSNNSVLLNRGEITREEFKAIVDNTRQWGEPGFVFAEHPWTLLNPCLTGDALIKTDKGEIALKNLVERYHQGEAFFIVSNKLEDESLEYKQLLFGEKTRENTEILEIELEDGTTLKLTPDHKVYVENKGWVLAKDLNPETDVLLKLA